MNTHIVIYQLDDSSADYGLISRKIKTYPNWAKLYPRMWLIRTNKSTRSVRTELSDAIDGRGSIVVINITDSSWSSYRLDDDLVTWMKEHV